MNFSKLSIFIFSFLFVEKCFSQLTAHQLSNWQAEGRVYAYNAEISGLYNNDAMDDYLRTLIPQTVVLHNYNSSVHSKVLFGAQMECPDELYEKMKGVIDFEGKKPEFYITIQRGHYEVTASFDPSYYNPDGKDVDLIRPHYALFKDAVVDNPQLVDNTYNVAADFEESFIVRMMPDNLSLTNAEGGVSAHPGPGYVVLSPNNYGLEGDRRSPWMFFSYFKTTDGRQLLTLHYVVTDEDKNNLALNHFGPLYTPQGRSNPHPSAPLNTLPELFARLNGILPGNPYMEAVSEVVIKGTLTPQAEYWLDLGIAERQHIERMKPAVAKVKPMMAKINRLENIPHRSGEEEKRYQQLRELFYEDILPNAIPQLDQQTPHIVFALEDHINNKTQLLQSGQSETDWNQGLYAREDNLRKHMSLLFDLRKKYLSYLEKRILDYIWVYDDHHNRVKPSEGTKERETFDRRSNDLQWRIDNTYAQMHALREKIAEYYEKNFGITLFRAQDNKNHDQQNTQGNQAALDAMVEESISQRQQIYQQMIEYYQNHQRNLQWAVENDPSSDEKRQNLELNQQKMKELEGKLSKKK